jgi:uncharacterized membrane protein HdeD (DUF308 family)
VASESGKKGFLHALVHALKDWPLLITGLTVIAVAISMAPPSKDNDTLIILIVLGSVLLGAGIARVIVRDDDQDDQLP